MLENVFKAFALLSVIERPQKNQSVANVCQEHTVKYSDLDVDTQEGLDSLVLSTGVEEVYMPYLQYFYVALVFSARETI